MPTTLVPPSWRGRCNEGRKLWMVYDDRADSYFAPLEAGEPTEPLLTGCRVLTKTESVSESVDKITGECLRLQLFFLCPPRIDKLLFANRAPMRSGTASAFWRWRRRRLPGPARTPASTTLLKSQVLGRELCIATFPREMH